MNAFFSRALLLLLTLFLIGCSSYPKSSNSASTSGTAIDIPFEQFTLPNGLRVIVHTDRKAPIVAVNVWYHVGAKNEPAGRSGFAHLFEHLMFQGSEHFNGEFFEPFIEVGATDQNGTTNADRTNYFENVPTTALDMALWMESDRMGHLLGAIDETTVDEQRGVVQNEKRQGENQPYGQAWDALTRALYPKGHPYHHGVIGSMNDLNAASLEDVKQWFRTWYGPNNAVLVLAGDIDVETAREKVTRYFGDIPAGPTMPQPPIDVAQRSESTREVLTDQVPQVRIYRAWNAAEYGSKDLDQLQILAYILGGSRTSRLDQRLLHQDRLVDNIYAGVSDGQLGSNFLIIATIKQDADPATVEAIIDEELHKLLAEGPTAEELARAKTSFRAGFIRGIERIGGFGGKADTLAECAVFTGDPGCFRASLANLDTATATDLQAVGQRWLSAGDHTLLVEPGPRTAIIEDPTPELVPFEVPAADPRYSTVTSDVDRSLGVPQTETFPQLIFPTLERATLSNGTQIILAQRHDIPVVQFLYKFPRHFATEPQYPPGVINFMMSMLDEGAGERDALAFADAATALGAQLSADAGLDGVQVSLSALKENLEPSLALYADMLRAPRFDEKEIERLRATWIAGIAQEKAHPNALALRLLPSLLYGPNHPYAIPFTGSGEETAISALNRDDLITAHHHYLQPQQSATLIIIGDITLKEILPFLEQKLGDWRSQDAPKEVSSNPRLPPLINAPHQRHIYLIDQPGALQANIFAATLIPSSHHPETTAFELANDIIGGIFSSRLNMNLREDKHWSYGARSAARPAQKQRLWIASTPVQIDKTAPAIQEVQQEIYNFASGQQPPSVTELEQVRRTRIRSLPGAYETAEAVLGTLSYMVDYQQPDDYIFQRMAEIEAMTPQQVSQAAQWLEDRDNNQHLIWLVIGDLNQIEAPIRALGLGDITILDNNGQPVLDNE